ncbi:oxysterol-binding protein-related protein 6-like [Ostrinia furnacalis]|uniref:oxysterol-binding protein-related protein 6-like n=1 Tax=Ostrinia furnacalis TaxID=93504 RepID=UPI0010390FCB|nr:oxysterol-binding protein-related protein 6-like [Ostrinia furnacalis]
MKLKNPLSLPNLAELRWLLTSCSISEMNQGGLKHAATESRLDNKRERRRGASGRAAALRRAPSDSDCSGETASLSADSGDRAVRPVPPPTRITKSRSRRRGSEWEVLEGLKDGQRFEKRPDVFNGYLHKKRKWPLKGWHKRFFVVDGGILVYARSPTDVARGRLHGSVDVGLSVISAKARRRRIDIDADEFIYHLRAKTQDVFRTWLSVLKVYIRLSQMMWRRRIDIDADEFIYYLRAKTQDVFRTWLSVLKAHSPHSFDTMGVARGRLHGSVDVGLSVISAKARRRRIDIDADEFIYHLRAKTQDVFRTWLSVLKAHRERRRRIDIDADEFVYHLHAKTQDVFRTWLNSSVAKARCRRIDIDADEFIYHLRAKTQDVFRTWLSVLKAHRLYRQHLLTFGARESVPKIHAPLEDLPPTETSSRLVSPTSPPLRGPQAGFVSGTPGGRLASWIIESGGPLENASRELGQAQLSVQQLQRLLEALELQQQVHHDTDVSLEGASPNVKKDRRKFGLRKKKSNSKCASVELAPPHIDPSSSHMALSALTAPPSPGGGASSVPNSAASLPIAFLSTFLASTLVPCAAARPQSLPGAEALGTGGGAGGPASITSLTPDHQLREDFTVLAKDLVASLKGIVSTLVRSTYIYKTELHNIGGLRDRPAGGPASITSLSPDHQLREDFTVLAKDLVASLKGIVSTLVCERGRLRAAMDAAETTAAPPGAVVAALRTNLTSALQQNSELRSRLSRIHDASDIAEISSMGNNSEPVNRQFQQSLSYSSSCVSASEFFDAEEHDEDLKPTEILAADEAGVIELDGDSSSEAGSLSSEEGSASSDNSDGAMLSAEQVTLRLNQNGIEPRAPCWARRTCLPCPRPTPGGPSLWNLLYKNIGKDLSQISMPVTINEPLNMLQGSSLWNLLYKNIGKDLSQISMPVTINEPLNMLQVSDGSGAPGPRPTPGGPSLWNLLYKNIGKDLSQISMPVTINEPLNMLQDLSQISMPVTINEPLNMLQVSDGSGAPCPRPTPGGPSLWNLLYKNIGKDLSQISMPVHQRDPEYATVMVVGPRGPCPRPTPGGPSLWNLLYKNIGKDLSQISMPVTINEPLNMLQVSNMLQISDVTGAPGPRPTPGSPSLWNLLYKNIGKDLSQISMPVTINEPLNMLQVRNMLQRQRYVTSLEPRAQCWARRTCLPCPRPTPGGPSLWNLLYKNIGKDLSQISMPVTINEPLNMLQRLCEELEYSELLDAAAECKNAVERIALIAAFAVSAYASSAHRAASKPFNPLLAETYECVRDDKGFRFIAEQVSHHPPISACHAESPRWCFWQEARIKTKFWGKSMEFQPTGRVHVRLITTGDHYSWNKVTTCVHNLFGGQRWVDQYGDMHITCHGTDISCKLNFIKASSWSSTRHEVRGCVTGNGTRLRLQGRWSEALYAGEPPAARCLWRPGAMPPEHELYYGFTRFAMELNEMEPGMRQLLPHTDTRLRPDQRALEEGDVDAAEQYKHSLEQSQRERRRGVPEHTPAWFRKRVENGEETWVFTGEYWKAREAGFADDAAPRIW